MRIETLAIGDEILAGNISDTNSTFVAENLLRSGLLLLRQTVIPDNERAISDAIKEISNRADIVVCFGGLGPTSDDKTAGCVANILGLGLVAHEPSKGKLVRFYRERNRELTTHVLKQVNYPTGSEPIPNLNGLAPGFRAPLGNCLFYFLPGVPEEMKAMWKKWVLPDIITRVAPENERVSVHSWRCIGIHESELQHVLDPIEAVLPKGSIIGYRTVFPENHVTLYFRSSAESCDRAFDDLRRKITELLREWCYTETDEELEHIVGKELAERQWKIAIAESCTGGLTLQRLTRIAGASDYVWGGCAVYQLDAKKKLLGLELGREEEAVSQECSYRLAESLKRVSGCEITAAVTGYMGPTGGTLQDPVGTIYLCVLGDRRLERRLLQTGRSRDQTQWGASAQLLNLIRLYT